MGAQVHKRCLGMIGEKKDETVAPPLQANLVPPISKASAGTQIGSKGAPAVVCGSDNLCNTRG